jgi:hypothetical protein
MINFLEIFFIQLKRHSLFIKELINQLVEIAALLQNIFVKSQILIYFESYLIDNLNVRMSQNVSKIYF